MDEDQLNDLKQFVAATVSQTEQRLTEFVATTVSQTEQRLTERLDRLEEKVDNGFAGVADALEQVNEHVDDLDHRVIRLEQKAA